MVTLHSMEHSHITWELAAMDSCFSLIWAHHLIDYN